MNPNSLKYPFVQISDCDFFQKEPVGWQNLLEVLQANPDEFFRVLLIKTVKK